MLRTLIDAAELHANLHTPGWVVVDCRFDLADPAAGERSYAAGHIPNARYAHLDRDLSSPITPTSGRHPLPDPTALARTLGGWGIDSQSQVIAYDQDSGAFAARLWWLLRWLGHEAVAVLDGGFAEWLRRGYPTSIAAATTTPTTFVPRLRPDLVVTAETVATLVRDAQSRVLDARAPERYAGTVEPLDSVAGHIPGARNFPFTSNLDADKRFLPPTELARRYAAALEGVDQQRTAVMCGSGVTACHLLLAMEHAGMTGAKLYAGSWSEWIRDPTRPVTKGSAP
jgi:thiosulfate/3-mercaptopyruvate sulfurtransferase